MAEEEGKDRRAFIRKRQIWFGIVFCILFPTVSAYFQPDPIPSETVRSFGIRFLEAVIGWFALSGWLLGKSWDTNYKRREVNHE